MAIDSYLTTCLEKATCSFGNSNNRAMHGGKLFRVVVLSLSFSVKMICCTVCSRGYLNLVDQEHFYKRSVGITLN